MNEEILSMLFGLAATVVMAAAGYLATWLRAKAKTEKAQAAVHADVLVDRIVEREVLAAEQSGQPGDIKKRAATNNIMGALGSVGKQIGKSLIQSAAASVGSRIEATVRKSF